MTTFNNFDAAWDGICEKIGWFMERDHSSAETDTIIAILQDFLAQWHESERDPQNRPVFEKTREVMDYLERRQRARFYTDLSEVIIQRLLCFLTEQDFKDTVRELTRGAKSTDSKARSAEAEFRKMDELVDEAESGYSYLWTKLRCDWSNRVDDSISRRLAQWRGEELQEWRDDLIDQVGKLQELDYPQPAGVKK